MKADATGGIDWLKAAVMLLMVLDHWQTLLVGDWWSFEWFLLGRLVYPAFVVLVAYGVTRSRDVGRYLWRLAGWAMVAQVPYLACFGSGVNVLFALSLVAGLGAYWMAWWPWFGAAAVVLALLEAGGVQVIPGGVLVVLAGACAVGWFAAVGSAWRDVWWCVVLALMLAGGWVGGGGGAVGWSVGWAYAVAWVACTLVMGWPLRRWWTRGRVWAYAFYPLHLALFALVATISL